MGALAEDASLFRKLGIAPTRTDEHGWVGTVSWPSEAELCNRS